MSLTPFKNDNKRSRFYKGNTLGYSFTFQEDGEPLDLTVLTDITVKLTDTDGETVFEQGQWRDC